MTETRRPRRPTQKPKADKVEETPKKSRKQEPMKTIAKRTDAGKRKEIRVQVPTRLYLLAKGELKIEDLDDEEIRRGQLRGKTGKFAKPAAWIPRELAVALQQEQLKRFRAELMEIVPDAIRAIREQVNSRHLMPGDATRLRAAELVFERVFGKVSQAMTADINIKTEKSFDDVIEASLVEVEDVVDAEVVEDDLDNIKE